MDVNWAPVLDRRTAVKLQNFEADSVRRFAAKLLDQTVLWLEGRHARLLWDSTYHSAHFRAERRGDIEKVIGHGNSRPLGFLLPRSASHYALSIAHYLQGL